MRLPNRKYICDHCRKEYQVNDSYNFFSRTASSRVTGFSFMGNRTYLIHSQDLCDDCLDELYKWFFENSQPGERKCIFPIKYKKEVINDGGSEVSQ